jgi:hypothetical protein
MLKLFRYLSLSTLFLIFGLHAFGQKKYTVSGVLRDAATGETLIGANVRVVGLPNSGGATNSYGFYTLTIPEGDYMLQFSYIGYQTYTQQVSLHKSETMNLSLKPAEALKEVVIRSDKPNDDNVTSPVMGAEKLSMAQINALPVVF